MNPKNWGQTRNLPLEVGHDRNMLEDVLGGALAVPLEHSSILLEDSNAMVEVGEVVKWCANTVVVVVVVVMVDVQWQQEVASHGRNTVVE